MVSLLGEEEPQLSWERRQQKAEGKMEGAKKGRMNTVPKNV